MEKLGNLGNLGNLGKYVFDFSNPISKTVLSEDGFKLCVPKKGLPFYVKTRRGVSIRILESGSKSEVLFYRDGRLISGEELSDYGRLQFLHFLKDYGFITYVRPQTTK